MVLKYHNSDYTKLPKEAEVMDALRPFNLPPGNYSMPRPSDMKEMGSPEYQEKCKKGPVAMMTVLTNGPMKMGSALVNWFIFSIIVGIFSGYVAGIVLAPGTDYMMVFRITSVVAFCCYTLALWPHKIWYYHGTAATIKTTVDGFIFALITGGTFGWLWPIM